MPSAGAVTTSGALTGRWPLEKVVGNARSFGMAATGETPMGGAESYGFVSEKKLFDSPTLEHRISIFSRENDVFSFDRGRHMGLF